MTDRTKPGLYPLVTSGWLGLGLVHHHLLSWSGLTKFVNLIGAEEGHRQMASLPRWKRVDIWYTAPFDKHSLTRAS